MRRCRRSLPLSNSGGKLILSARCGCRFCATTNFLNYASDQCSTESVRCCCRINWVTKVELKLQWHLECAGFYSRPARGDASFLNINKTQTTQTNNKKVRREFSEFHKTNNSRQLIVIDKRKGSLNSTHFLSFQMSRWISWMRFPFRYKYRMDFNASTWTGKCVNWFPLKFTSRSRPDFDVNVFGRESFVSKLFLAINVLKGHCINTSTLRLVR